MKKPAILILLAGSGVRFEKAGFKKPKPLISVAGRSMIEWAITCFPPSEQFIFVCQNKDLGNTQLKKTLLKYAPKAKAIGIPYQASGPIASALCVQKCIDLEAPVIIGYCDFINIWDYQKFLKFAEGSQADGIIPCFHGFHPLTLSGVLYGSVKVRGDKVLELKEKYSFTKKRSDGYESPGIYYFRSGELFLKYARRVIKEKIKVNGEHYVSLLYNPMIKDGLDVRVFEIKKSFCLGVPEDVKYVRSWMEKDKKRIYRGKNKKERQTEKDYWQKYLSSNPA